MLRFVSGFVMAGVLLSIGGGSGAGGTRAGRALPFHLLEPGEYHDDEVGARSGERWLGLFVDRRGGALAPVMTRVTRVHDPVVDEDDGVATGRKVSARGPRQPLFMLRGSSSLAPGPLVTAYRGSWERSLGNGAGVPLSLGGKRYLLRVDARSRAGDETIAPGAQLILSEGERGQILYRPSEWGESYPPGDMGSWYLLWAGDLDRDGGLDLYVSVGYHYAVSQRMLFLSSAAGPGRLVRRVALFTRVCC